MYPIFGVVNTWPSQSETLVDNVYICHGRRQSEEAYRGKS